MDQLGIWLLQQHDDRYGASSPGSPAPRIAGRSKKAVISAILFPRSVRTSITVATKTPRSGIPEVAPDRGLAVRMERHVPPALRQAVLGEEPRRRTRVPLYQVAIGGIDHAASSTSSPSTAETSPCSIACM